MDTLMHKNNKWERLPKFKTKKELDKGFKMCYFYLGRVFIKNSYHQTLWLREMDFINYICDNKEYSDIYKLLSSEDYETVILGLQLVHKRNRKLKKLKHANNSKSR